MRHNIANDNDSAITALPQIITYMAMTHMADRWGRKPMLILSCLSMSAGYIFLATAASIQNDYFRQIGGAIG